MFLLPAAYTHLAAWCLVCLVLAVWLRRRPMVVVSLALLLWSLIPAVAGYHVTQQSSGPLGAHPGTWMLLILAAVSLLLHPGIMISIVYRYPFTTIALGAFVVAATLTTFLQSSSGGANLLVEQVIGPLMLFWVVVAFAPTDPAGLRLVRNTIVGAISLQALLAVVEWFLGGFLLFASDYARVYDPERFQRWMGTTDSHLVLAFAISVAAPLTVGIGSNWARVVLLGVQTMGALVTQSRFVLVVLAFVFLYLLFRGRMSAAARVAVSSVLAIGAYVAVSSALATGVRERLANDTGSTGARVNALQAFGDIVGGYWWAGDGLMSNFTVAREAGLGTSFESAFLMYAIDVGVVAALVYFGTMLALVARYGGRTVIHGSGVAALLGFASLQVFSGLGYGNLSGTYLWAVLALVVAGAGLAEALPVPHVSEEDDDTGQDDETRAPLMTSMSPGA